MFRYMQRLSMELYLTPSLAMTVPTLTSSETDELVAKLINVFEGMVALHDGPTRAAKANIEGAVRIGELLKSTPESPMSISEEVKYILNATVPERWVKPLNSIDADARANLFDCMLEIAEILRAASASDNGKEIGEAGEKSNKLALKELNSLGWLEEDEINQTLVGLLVDNIRINALHEEWTPKELIELLQDHADTQDDDNVFYVEWGSDDVHNPDYFPKWKDIIDNELSERYERDTEGDEEHEKEDFQSWESRMHNENIYGEDIHWRTSGMAARLLQLDLALYRAARH